MKNRVFTGIVPCIIAVAVLLCAWGAAAGESLTQPGEEGWMSDYTPSSADAEILDYIETQELFVALSDKTLIAASGAGAWEGRLNVDAGGGFTGYYYDADAGDNVVYEVSFSGHFAPNAEVHGSQYWLWVGALSTQEVPGTSAAGEYGERIEYTEAPFRKDRFMVLTLIHTPTEQIPETVRDEIGGTYGEWNDYSRFVTLTRQEDGWGFFAEGYDGYESGGNEPESIPTATIYPEPTETPKTDYHPLFKTELENGNILYDFGLITFEGPADSYVETAQITGTGEERMVSGFLRMPFRSEYADILQAIHPTWGPDDISILPLTIANIYTVRPDDGTDAESYTASVCEGSGREYGYATVAGRSVRWIQDPAYATMPYCATEYLFPLSGNRILTIIVVTYRDGTLKEEADMFLDTLQIHDFPDGEETGAEEQPAVQPGAPAAEGTPAPAGRPEQAGDSAVQAGEWTGYWMTGDDAAGELVITSGRDGTMHMKAFFLRTFDIEADLKPLDGSSCSFETAYGHYSGVLTHGQDGTLRFEITGGLSMEDDENEMYYFFSGREYLFRAADYDELWYEAPAEGPEDDADWLGEWTARYGELTSSLRIIQGSQGEYIMRVTFSTGFTAAGLLEKTDSRTMDFNTDEFFAMLTLNRKKHTIVMSETGSMSDEAYLWLDRVGAVIEYTASSSGTPAAAAEPEVKTAQETEQPAVYSEAEADLLPIAGRTDYMQVPVAGVDATSYIVGKDPSAYMPFRMTDGDETTSYQFSTKVTKPGSAYLYFDFAVSSAVDELWIKNGYWKNADGMDQYRRNCRVKEMTVEFRYAGNDAYLDPMPVSLKDDSKRADWTAVALGRKTNVTGIRIRVDEVYRGSTFKNDVCVSEVMFVKRAD